MLATRVPSRGDLNHNDSEMVHRLLAGLAAVTSVLLSCFFSQLSAWVDCEVCKYQQQ